MSGLWQTRRVPPRGSVSIIWLCQTRNSSSLKEVFSPTTTPLASPEHREGRSLKQKTWPQVDCWEVFSGYTNYGTQTILREAKCLKILLLSENDQLSSKVCRILSNCKRGTPQSWFVVAITWSFLFTSPGSPVLCWLWQNKLHRKLVYSLKIQNKC